MTKLLVCGVVVVGNEACGALVVGMWTFELPIETHVNSSVCGEWVEVGVNAHEMAKAYILFPLPPRCHWVFAAEERSQFRAWWRSRCSSSDLLAISAECEGQANHKRNEGWEQTHINGSLIEASSTA